MSQRQHQVLFEKCHVAKVFSRCLHAYNVIQRRLRSDRFTGIARVFDHVSGSRQEVQYQHGGCVPGSPPPKWAVSIVGHQLASIKAFGAAVLSVHLA